MKKNNLKKRIISIHSNGILFLLVVFLLISCVSDRKKGDKPKSSSKDISNKEIPQTFNTINFYFENSGSMNGYLDGTNFKKTMHEIIDDNNPNLNPYFVNTKEYATSDLLSKIDTKNIGTKGTGSSDHQFIFTNAIKNAIGNNLSIVVTDGIYSTPTGNVDVVEVDIKKAFIPALKENAIETVVLKMSSHYKGTYYTESNCDNVTIDQERPYYILLFGNKETIDNALKNIVIIKDLPGFKEQAGFFLTDSLKVDYTVLTQGEEKKGSFRRIGYGKGLVKEIEDAERYESKSGRYLQFAIAVDYSKLSITDSYLMDNNNYKIDEETGYEVIKIKLVSELINSSLTKREIEKNKMYNPTHIIVVKAKTKILGNLKIEVENNFPDWIIKTGTVDDCEVNENSYQTYAFDKLMIGISKAYKKINIKDEYFEINVKIKH